MSHVFISYARSTAKQAQAVAEALRRAGYSVWLDDDLPAHRAYTDVLEERLKAAKAVVVIWSAEAARSQWVRAEADLAREAGTLVQLSIDGAIPPLPFNQIQCADMKGWIGDTLAPGWRKVLASITELTAGESLSRQSTDAPPTPKKPSIAVLPFAKLSAGAEQDYFADGMVEEIVGALSRNKSIFVIASGSSLSLKGSAIGAQEAGRKLGVRYVLEGSVRKAGGRVRIAVKLIDVADGAQIWADRFEDTMEDVFALQDEVARSVAGVIEPTILFAEIDRVSRRPTENMGAYDLYLRATPLLMSFARGEVFAGLDLLERAIVLDPDYARASGAAALGYSQALVAGWSEEPPAHRRRALELAQRALRFAGDDAEVLSHVAATLWHLHEDLDDAIALIDRSIALNPGSALVWMHSGWIRVTTGATELGIDHLETAMRLDPLSNFRPLRLTGIGVGRYGQGRIEEAIALFKESAQVLSGYPTNPVMLGLCYGRLGQLDLARAAIARAERLTGRPIEDWVLTAVVPGGRDAFLSAIERVRTGGSSAHGGGR